MPRRRFEHDKQLSQYSVARGCGVPLVAKRRDRVGWLTFDHPDRLNAFTATDYEELKDALLAAAADSDTRVVVVTGRGRAFSAGAHRSLLDGTASAQELQKAATEFTAMLETLVSFEKPVLAAVNGLAVGIGCTMLLHCDLVVMAESARVRFPFTALGVVPEAGSSATAARLRRADATWAMLSSEWVDAAGAVEMGLAWRAVPDAELQEYTQRAAATIAAHDPDTVAATKRLLTSGRAELVRTAMARELAEMTRLRPKST
jgi:enoyl-CoA hydratase/carnithine racemase